MRALGLAALCIAGCASQPTHTPAAGAAPATAASGTIQQHAAVEAAMRAGYSPKTRQGIQMYCREETPIGTRFSDLHCYTVEQLTDLLRDRDSLHDALAKPMLCGGGASCVAQ